MLLFKKLIHFPRRIMRDFLMVVRLVQFFLINRFGREPATEPGSPVVSLTTYGSRSHKVYLAIESIAHGDVRPSRLILWIDDKALFENLPATLRRLQKRGLEVKLSKNYGPHTKYYPYVILQDSFDLPLITADDDRLYPKYWLSKLADAHREFPNVVNCFWAHVVAINENGIGKYTDWKPCYSIHARHCHQADGVMGVIYPPAFLMLLKLAGDAFKDCCPKGDDLWLHVQAIRAGYKVRQIFTRLPYFSFQTIPGTQHIALSMDNVEGVGNDLQIGMTYKAADIQKLRADVCTPDI